MRSTSNAAALACAMLTTTALTPRAHADENATKATCRDAYERSQAHRQGEKLLAARQELRVCASDTCPPLVRTDCVQWLSEVDRAVPSMVFEGKVDARSVFDVTVLIDGTVAAAELDGRPIEVDPGVHTVEFERPHEPAVVEKVIVREGERNRLLTAVWTTARATPEAAPSAVDPGIPTSVYVLAGVAVLGLADFAVFAVVGNKKKGDFESTCAPFCSSASVNDVKMTYVVGDIGLGVGVVAAATSAVLLLMRPEPPKAAPRTTASSSVVVTPELAGAVLDWRVRF